MNPPHLRLPSRAFFHFLVLVSVLACLLGAREAVAQAAPTNVTAAASVVNGSTVQLALQWTDNSSNEGGFGIYYSINSSNGPWTFLGNVGANQTSVAFDVGSAFTTVGSNAVFLVGSLLPGSTVVANYSTDRPFVTWPNASAPTLNAPTGLSSSFPATNFVRLSWTDNSNSEAITEVSARDLSVGGSSFQVVVVAEWYFRPLDLFYYFQPGKSYEVRIRSANFANSYTGYSTITVNVPGTVNNTPPPAPSNLTVAAHVASSVNQFGLYWDDNATDETGFEIQEKPGGGPDTGYVSLGVLGGVAGTNLGIGLGLANNYTTGGARDFRVRAVRGNGPFAIVSGFSAAAGADMESFNPPTDLRLTAPADNGRVMLFWNDNATTETGYDIEYRVGGDGAFAVLGQLPSGNFSRVQDSGGIGFFPPSTQVEFRVRAYKTGSTTAYVTGSLTMPPMTPPTNLAQGAAGAEGALNLTWTDNSSNELAYVVQARKTAPGTPETGFSDVYFTLVNNLLTPNITTAALTTSHLIPGYTYELRVAAMNRVSQTAPNIYSNPTNVLTLTPSFNAPTNLRQQSGTLGETSVTLNWNDNSTFEHGYLIYSRPGGTTGTPVLFGVAAANATSAVVGLTPGVATEFFVAAYVSLNPTGESVSAQSNGLTVTARDAMTSPIYLELHQNEVMATYTLTTSAGSSVSTRSITGLPAGLSFNSTNGQITGTPTGSGVTTSPVQVTFANGWTHNNSLAIRILRKPAANVFPAQVVAMGTPGSVPLADKFTDPDASSAVRVNTNLAPNGGDMDFILFDAATPLHVANFMGYVNRGDYVNTVFHRSIAGFISQGGAFRAGAGPTQFTAVPTQPQVTNEPGISNVRGTVALAKLPSGPSTGTNQFFVNLANNGPNLDFQNGGFTAFARVTAPGMAVADALAGLPTSDYSVTVDTAAQTFDDFPVNAPTAPLTMNNTLAVRINSVTALPVLTYTVTSNSNSAVVTAAIVSGHLSLTPVAPGTANVVVRATDLENRFVETTVAVTVNNSLANWAAGENLPSGQQGPLDDPDFDGRTNLLEYGLMTTPGAADGGAQPVLGSVVDGAATKATITFKVRKFAALTYIVQSSGNLSNWTTTVWTSADGFGAANVVSAVDNADHTLVTVRDPTAYAPGADRFLRVRVTSP